ncbi:hypothetical protein AB4Z45_32010 [Paenibacillus sp. MCAF9]|uniref:hypothetical protein n=1 Tax=Paenibacillus sp. MCAF9 TaxID=3233046 RepID=UPI003F94F0F6
MRTNHILLVLLCLMILTACSSEYEKQIKIGEQALSEKKYDSAITAFSSALEEKPNEKQASEFLIEAKQQQIISEVEVVISESKIAMEAKKYDVAEIALLTARDKYRNESFIKPQLTEITDLLNVIDIKMGISDAITAKEASNFLLAETLITKVLNHAELQMKDKELAGKYLVEIKFRKNLAYLKSVAFSEEKFDEAAKLIASSINEVTQTDDSDFITESRKWYVEVMMEIANDGVKLGHYDFAYVYIDLVFMVEPNNEDAIELRNQVNQLVMEDTKKKEQEELKQQMTDYLSAYINSISRVNEAIEEHNSKIISSLRTQMMMIQLPSDDFIELSSYWKATLDASYNVAGLYEKINRSKSSASLSEVLTGKTDSKSYVNEYTQINEQIKIAYTNMGKGNEEVKRLREEYNITQ